MKSNSISELKEMGFTNKEILDIIKFEGLSPQQKYDILYEESRSKSGNYL